MISKLPKWVEISAFFLAFVAGSVNAIGLLGFSHQAVSHLSGVATRLGAELIRFNMLSALHLSLILASFVLGAILSGFYIRSSVLMLGRHYGIALFTESFLLIIAALTLRQGSFIGHYFASAACGLQNAMVTTYSGATIRTTHVTGLFTDLGIMIGARFRGVHFDKRRILLYSVLIIGFISGGMLGAISYEHLSFNALLIPASLTLTLAIIYRFWLQKEN